MTISATASDSSGRTTDDNNGNTLTKVVGSNTTTYAWDFENRLSSVTLPGSGGTVTFKYDPFGRRIYKSSSSGTSIYAYDGINLVEETNSSGSVVARYSLGERIDEPLAMLRSGATSYYHADGLDSVTSLRNTAGALAQTYTFDSFGKQTASSGSLTNPFQYTGREFDSETSLQFVRNRYYDPQAGRFLSEDPIRFKGGTNFYAYVLNDPVNYIDPLGFKPCKWYECKFWNWVPGVAIARCGIWSHYCLKVVNERKQEELAHPAPLTDDDLARGMGDMGKREIEICTQGDDNCKKLLDICGGPILGPIFRPPFGVR
jgi:RHS repeat-associated protein